MQPVLSPTGRLMRAGGYRQRKLEFRAKLASEAGARVAAGLPSRIPFIKKMLCDGRVPDAESSVVRCPEELALLSRAEIFRHDQDRHDLASDAFYRRLAAFNSSRAYSGFQAFPSDLDPSASGRYDTYILRPCETRFIGDLKFSWPAPANNELDASGMWRAVLVTELFQAFFSFNPSFDYQGATTIVHEAEHALHDTLPSHPKSLLRRFPEETERMAILKVISDYGDLEPFFTAWLFPGMDCPVLRAVRSLQPVFEERYGISEKPFSYAMNLWRKKRDKLSFVYPRDIPWGDIPFAARQYSVHRAEDSYRKVREAAKEEYERRCLINFRLPLSDIREIVSSL